MAKMSDALSDKGNGRRDFLRLTAITASAATVAAGSGIGNAQAATDSDSETLRDTAHTRAYYDSVRF